MLLNNFTLLYVEDDKTTQEMVKIILKNKVKELYIASDGQEGLDAYKDKKPDIILTDINMPVMDGLEMSAKIKSIDHHQPIVCLTAYSDIVFLKESINIGIDKYLIKPINDMDVFFGTLEAVAKDLQSDIDKVESERLIQVQAKVVSMGEMITNIAHQWRQPLGVISAEASRLELNLDYNNLTDDMIRKSTQNIVNQTQDLSKTIDDFMNFFDNTSTEEKEFNIKHTIDKVINLMKTSYESNFIKIVYTSEDCIFNENESQLSQALLSIVSNAQDAFDIKHIKHKRYLYIDLKQKDNEIIIILKDNAGGIPEDIIDKIFEPYFTTKFKSQGTGIGLYMAKMIIERNMGGELKVKNDGEGAVFTIKLNI